jgi:hypothetical protein
MQVRVLAAAIASLVVGSAVAQDAIIAKQLAGPPEEMAAMRAVEPIEAAIHSKSALIPITLERDKTGAMRWRGALPNDADTLKFLVLGDALSVRVAAPGETEFQSARALAQVAQETRFGIENANVPADLYEFDNAARGEWQLEVRSDSGASEAFVLIEGNSEVQLLSYQTERKQQLGDTITFAAGLTGDPANGAAVGMDAGTITRAMMKITAPSGAVSERDMASGRGMAQGAFVADELGSYQVQVRVEGVDRSGRALQRTAEHVLPIVADVIDVAADQGTIVSREGRLAVRVPVQSQAARGAHFRAFGEVWGVDVNGAEIPVAWVGGMVTAQNGAIEFGLDPRWIDRAGAKPPYALKNLRIEDPNVYASLDERAELALVGGLAASSGKRGGEITDDMRMGPRPAAQTRAKGVGTRLLLVHGYCSGGVWPTGNFSNASTFLDANQNRTHDQFARRIQTFGDTWNSFGIVAHSQGGAAALHLYTYYWSGLDRATGSRLIQSVGTPYQGTNLAGVLAALGGIFGVGCGTNNDLTYFGASAWLAGIPTSARAKVNYYTTSFRSTNWWTNDFCNFASDLVLSDPEDGTTEVAKGQLSGGVNRGNTAGQCHTQGMRDPAQFLDASRNSVMNSNAAR